MNRYAKLLNEHRRLGILEILAQDADYSTNETLLANALAAVGIAASHDQVKSCLAWLEEQGLVTVDSVGGLALAKLTRRGLDAARGLARVPGVARPEPEE